MQGRVVVVLAEGFEETEAVTVIDLLRRAGISVTVAGLSSREVTGSHGITIHADDILETSDVGYDAVILPGGMPGTTNLASSAMLLDFIARMYGAGRLCAAICAAPIVFAKAGILVGKKVTCYPGIESQLTGAIIDAEPVVRDGQVITSRGPATAITFALEIIAALANQDVARRVGDAVLHTLS